MAAIHSRVYEDLLAHVENHQGRFAQLARDYRREIDGGTLCFAVDYSELHGLIYSAEPGSMRVKVNDYILNTAEDVFTLLPGSVGELLSNLEARVPLRSKEEVLKILQASQAVSRFKEAFSAGVADEDQLMALYADCQSELQQTLGALADIVVRGEAYSSMTTLSHLLRQVLVPIQGLDKIGPLSEDAKAAARFVRSYLEYERPRKTGANRTDALNYAVALSFNTQLGDDSNEYLSIYSDSKHFLGACRANDRLRFKGDYLIRDLKYLQFRTLLQGMYSSPEQTLACVNQLRQLCEELVLQLRRYLESADVGRAESLPPPKLLDFVVRFERGCHEPFAFTDRRQAPVALRKDAEQLHDTLDDDGTLVRSLDGTLSELKASLKQLHDELGAFSPIPTDDVDARTYKVNLCRWLGFEESGSDTAPPAHDETMT